MLCTTAILQTHITIGDLRRSQERRICVMVTGGDIPGSPGYIPGLDYKVRPGTTVPSTSKLNGTRVSLASDSRGNHKILASVTG